MSLAFISFFTGHGGQIVDTSGDEDDGFDEILIPGDYKESGQIVDDEIYEEVSRPLCAIIFSVLIIRVVCTNLYLPVCYQNGTGCGLYSPH
jgi:hypothetical protein